MKQKIISIFMIILILVIPIYSASVYAGLSNLQAKGIDNVNGYIRRNDFVEISVTAAIEGDAEITPNQVSLKNVKAFDSCAAGVNGFDCIVRIPTTGTKSFIPSSIPFAVELYDDSSGFVEKADGSVAVDNNAPVIKSFSITPKTTTTGIVTLSYNIEDYAFSYGDTSKCSGIEKIELYENDLTGTLLATETLGATECRKSGTEEHIASGSGAKKICAKAYDKFMQGSAVVCDTFFVDNEAPAIDVNSLRIVDNRGNAVAAFSDNEINAIMTVDTLGDDLNKNSVSADLSALNPSQASYQNLAAVCGATSESATTCVWNFILKMSEGGAKNIIIKASDNYGNEGTQTISRIFNYDNIGPVINTLRTNKADRQGNYYASSTGNIFTAEIREDAGINKDDMLLHIDSRVYPAANCTPGWTCEWHNVNIGGTGTIKAYIGTDSKDILGNYVSQEKAIDVIVDNNKPKIFNITVTAVGGSAGDAYEGFAKTGDKLNVIAEISDTELSEAYADMSAVIQGASHVDARCNKEGNILKCIWNTNAIDISGYINGYLKFYFADVAGNTEIANKEITVYGLITEANPNYWKNTVSCMPSKVDRQVSSLISQRVYCHVSLSPLSGNLKSMLIDIDECKDTHGNNSINYVESGELLNNVIGSTDPYIKFTLKKMPLQIDKLDITCPLNIKSKVGNEITANYETENVSMTIGLYNMPLGEFSQSTQDKIDDARDNFLVKNKFIANLNNLFNLADNVCKGIQTYNRISQLYKSIGLTMDAISKGLYLAVLTAPAGAAVDAKRMAEQSVAQTLDEATKKGWTTFGNKMCKAISCRLFLDEVKWMPKPVQELGGWQKSVLDKADYLATAGGKLPGIQRGMGYGNDQTGYETHLTAHLNPRESLILSALTLCLPGVIYNLDKMRQIECMYVDCLQTYAKQGLPLQACEEQKSFAQCKYGVGELFAFTPMALLDSFSGLVKQALSSPAGLVDIFMGQVCAHLILTPQGGIPANLCLINNIFGLTVDVGEDFIGKESLFKKDKWEIQHDYCKRME